MKMWCKGSHRSVLVVGPLVFKFPKVSGLVDFIKCVLDDIFRIIRCRKPHGLEFLWVVFKLVVLPGLAENLREAICYFRTRHKLLARLYLPLLIVNIYHREKGVGNFPFEAEHEDFITAIMERGDPEALKAINERAKISGYSIHTFFFAKNFSFDGSQVRILDYGESGIEDILVHCGDQIEQLLLSVANSIRR